MYPVSSSVPVSIFQRTSCRKTSLPLQMLEKLYRVQTFASTRCLCRLLHFFSMLLLFISGMSRYKLDNQVLSKNVSIVIMYLKV